MLIIVINVIKRFGFLFSAGGSEGFNISFSGGYCEAFVRTEIAASLSYTTKEIRI